MGNSFSKITFRDLIKASELFENDYYAYNGAWLEAWKNINWENLNETSTDEVLEKVIGFLNKWKCRLPYSETLAKKIKQAHLDCLSHIEALKDETIENWDPNKEKGINNTSQRTERILLTIFSRFATIGEHFSYVAASKTLHFILPKLVVMWDNTIAMKYRVPMTSQQYVQKFLPKMQNMANSAITSYQRENNCSREEAITALNTFRSPKTIAKLLDEYNYMKYTRGEEITEPPKIIDESLKVNDLIEVMAFEGKESRLIARAPDGRVILFDRADPRSRMIQPSNWIKVRISRVAENYIIARYEEKKPRPKPSMLRLFDEFMAMKGFSAGEGLYEESVEKWMEDRKEAKDFYREMFKPENLSTMNEEDFESFLYFSNNRAWTQLYRQGRRLLKNLDELKKSIAHLQDESLDVVTRIRDVMRGGYLHLNGFGKNMATGILHVCDEQDRWGVWNTRTEGALKILKRKPPISTDHGISYRRINNELVKLKEELDTDLVMLDGFMWFISKYYPDP